MIPSRSSTDERHGRLLTFGLLMCPDCGRERLYVNFERGGMHKVVTADGEEVWREGSRRHISDAFCAECGHTYGRVETLEEVGDPGGRRYIVVERMVVCEDVAASAAHRYAARAKRRADGYQRPDGPAIAADAPPQLTEVQRRLSALGRG